MFLVWIQENAGVTSSGLQESAVLSPSAPRPHPVAGMPEDTILDRSDARGNVPADRTVTVADGELNIPIDELLGWERAEDEPPIDTRIGRLASLLGIAAVALAFLALMFAAGTDVAPLFRTVPGS